MRWRFSTYVKESGKASVQKSIDGFDDYGQAQFAARVKYLAATSAPNDWSEPQALKLSGVTDLYEIRFKNARKQTRAIGFFGPDSDEFTITVVATHKCNVYTPVDAIQTAGKRRDEIVADPLRRSSLKIDGEDFPPIEDET